MIITTQLQLTLLSVLFFFVTTVIAEPSTRTFSFDYKTSIDTTGVEAGPLHIFIPLAVQNAQQTIIAEQIDAPIPGTIETEDTYGNRYWHGSVDSREAGIIDITITTTVERREVNLSNPLVSRAITAAESSELEQFLKPNAKVVVGHPILKPIQEEVRDIAGSDDPAKLSRAIYDWVVENVEYKKVGTGWGNGDTFWACNERYGNCTDFHALLISLARSENIPARFEIGFPVPASRNEGTIGGYHCWVQVYLPSVGWFPVDASEAFKHPENKDYFYGSHPQDRIHFSTGRDLKLGASLQGKALNYFVYPHVEVNGKPFTGKINNSFAYRDIANPVKSLATN